MLKTNQRTQSTVSTKTLEVALLLSDIKEAEEISKIFRAAGVIPHFYEDLRSFWNGTLENIPSLCLVDVKKMSDGELILQNHPHVKTSRLPLSFIYSAETAPLTFSTFELFHLGLINRSLNLKGQIKSLLRTLNRINEVAKTSSVLEGQNVKLEKQLTSIVSNLESLKEKSYYDEKLKLLFNKLEKQKVSSGFFEAVEKVFGDFPDFLEFASLELSQNGQKLVSPTSFSEKFREIPSLWLGQTCKNGIANFAQNMANQVAIDLMGGDLMALMIKGVNEFPDMMIFVRAPEDFLNAFDWDALERQLSSLYTYFELRTKNAADCSSKFVQPWELMGKLDQIFFGKLPEIKLGEASDLVLVDVDLTSLLEVIRFRPTMRFYWKDFFNDFINRFESQHKISYKISCLGMEHVAFIVESKYSEEFFTALKIYTLKYPYWRYFEDVDTVLAKTVRPVVKMVPVSADAYLRFVKNTTQIETVVAKPSVEKVEQAKPKANVPIRRPIQSQLSRELHPN